MLSLTIVFRLCEERKLRWSFAFKIDDKTVFKILIFLSIF